MRNKRSRGLKRQCYHSLSSDSDDEYRMMLHPEVVDWAEYGVVPVNHEEIINLTDSNSDNEEVNKDVLPADPREAQEVINLTDSDSDNEEVNENVLPADPGEAQEVINLTDSDSDTEEVGEYNLPLPYFGYIPRPPGS